jgi:cysteinyl-tRNA synthetase
LGKIDMALLQNGLESFESESRNRTPPAPTSKPAGGLHVYNSLSREKEPFVTRDGSNQVTWYICGPTVGDSSHLGHARNYVTFDIIRRIMGEYFGYNILYVMNVTDVDAKIIDRARRNYLLYRFCATATNPDQVTVEFEEAYASEHLKQRMQVEATVQEYGRATSSRQLDEIADVSFNSCSLLPI